MVPRCYPTSYVTANGKTRMVVENLASVSGLVRWKDYIPVQQTTASPHIPNSYQNDGAIELDVLTSTTGKVAGKDYIKVYEDASATDPWEVSAVGYIPVYIPSP